MSHHYDPPKKKIEYWCDKCGLKQWRDERIKHRVGGVVCNGRVVKATYVLATEEAILNAGFAD